LRLADREAVLMTALVELRVKVPAAVGVPLITPEKVFSVRPSGSVPAVAVPEMAPLLEIGANARSRRYRS
jgi:hypothetical protein